jgi:hypothetical protein
MGAEKLMEAVLTVSLASSGKPAISGKCRLILIGVLCTELNVLNNSSVFFDVYGTMRFTAGQLDPVTMRLRRPPWCQFAK